MHPDAGPVGLAETLHLTVDVDADLHPLDGRIGRNADGEEVGSDGSAGIGMAPRLPDGESHDGPAGVLERIDAVAVVEIAGEHLRRARIAHPLVNWAIQVGCHLSYLHGR